MSSAGQGSISFAQKQTGGGPPFAATAANNGLSVDPVTGKIVFGNDVGAVGMPGALITNREVDLNDQAILFTDGNGFAGAFDAIIEGAPGNIFKLYFSGIDTANNVLMQQNAGPSQWFVRGTDALSGNTSEIIVDSADATAQSIWLAANKALRLQSARDDINMQVDDVTKSIFMTVNGGGTATLRAVAAELEFEAFKLKTGAPSVNGSGKWKLGKNIVAATVFDNTHYVEVMIDGVVRKLATVV